MMVVTWKAMRIAGWVLHVLIGGLMIFAGLGKVSGSAPPEVAQMLSGNLVAKLRLIGAGEILAAVLMLIPRTLSLGVLLTTGFWGGVILFHMNKGDGYGPGAVLLLLTWLGAYLRLPATFASFLPGPGRAATTHDAEPTA